MTKKLEELLNLPENKEIAKKASKETKAEIEEARSKMPADNFFRDMEEFDKIATALPSVKGLGDACDAEFDSLAQRATDAYDDLMDLGMNVEARYSSRIFEVAQSALKNAIDAKSAKIDKKLKMIELQIKKAKLDQDANKPNGDETMIAGEGTIITDRNSLLEKLRSMK